MSEIEFMDIFSDNLESLMNDVGIGVNQLAREINVSKAVISRYINKQRIPSLKTFLNICIALDCQPDDLVPLYEFIV